MYVCVIIIYLRELKHDYRYKKKKKIINQFEEMVNLTETKSERDASISSFPSNLFSLSRPINLFENQLEKTKNLILKLNPHASLFEFIEPFESSHANNQASTTTTGKLTNKLTNSKLNTAANRSKPYTLCKPDKQSDKKSGDACSNGTYHQTAILARLSSISNTFKSIFVRPKNTKHIQLNSITTNKTAKPPPDFKIKLFSTNNNATSSVNSNANSNANGNSFAHQKCPSVLDQKIEKIICDSVDTYSNWCGSSVVSTLSTTSNLTSDSLSSHTAAATTNSSSIKCNSLAISKWTCMVCLSKHKMDVKVCSICGSQKQNQKFCIKQTNSGSGSGSGSNTTLKTISSNQQQQHTAANTAYLKTWTCSYCSFGNDSLKIVCMNCRSSKQMRHGDQAEQRVRMNLKRARRHHHHHHAQSQNTLNTSNEENELEQSVLKKPKQDQSHDTINSHNNNNNTKPCMCKCNEDKSKLNTSNSNPNTLSNKNFLAAAETSTTQNLVTPTKPSNFYDTSKKSWTCSVCLVSNDNDKVDCVCCTTPREQHKSDKTSDMAPDLNQLAKQNNKQDNKQAKWKCQTCLVLNDDDKRLCVCCSTSRDNLESSAKTKFSELVAAASGSVHSMHSTGVVANANISFGLKTNDLSRPISFGSNFCVGDTNSGFSLTTQQHNKPADKTNDTAHFSFGTNEPTKQLAPVVQSNEQNQSNINFSASNDQAVTNSNPPAFDHNQANTIEQNKPTSFSLFQNSTQTPKANNLFSFHAGTTQSAKPACGSLFANSSNSSNQPIGSVGSDQTSASNEFKPAFCLANSESSSSSNKAPNNPFDKCTTNDTKSSSSNLAFSFVNSSNQKTTNNNVNFGSSDLTFSTNNTNNNNKPNSSSTDSKPAFSLTTSTQQSAEPPPPPSATTNATLFSSNSQIKPAFSFGKSEAQQSAFSSFANCTQSANKTNSPFLFASNDTPAKPTPSTTTLFGSSSSTESKPAFCFGNSEPPAKAAATTTTLFGSLSSSSEPKATFSFGNSVNSVAAKPTLFGSTTTETKSSEQPFVFGGQSEKPKSAETPFNFGNTSSSSNFNFGCSSNPFASTCSTPSTKPAFGSLGPSTPTTSSTAVAAAAAPFGLGAINQQNNVASPSLSQVLSAQTTPSTRLIKKPTRRLKK